MDYWLSRPEFSQPVVQLRPASQAKMAAMAKSKKYDLIAKHCQNEVAKVRESYLDFNWKN